jgi:hypothetical protein
MNASPLHFLSFAQSVREELTPGELAFIDTLKEVRLFS